MIDLHAINKHGNHTANQGWQHSVLEPDDFVSYLTVVGMEFLPNASERRQLRTAQANRKENVMEALKSVILSNTAIACGVTVVIVYELEV